jgi:hypothetical protein
MVERALIARSENEMKSAFGERLGDGQTEAARGSGDQREFRACGHDERVAEAMLGDGAGEPKYRGPAGS